jgi:hypothetical protein
MLRKSLVALLAIVLFGAVFAAPARAQSQAVSLNIGYFTVRGLDARAAENDVLAAELNGGYYDALAFDLNHFNNVTFSGEWLIGLGDFLEGGVGVGYYSREVPSVSANFVNTNGSEIQQTLRLRIVPITATVRFLPLGRRAIVEPYVGGGLAIMPWRYTEVGQFVFPNADGSADIVSANYEGSGTSVGPVILGGARFPFGNYAIGGEIRWQRGTGTLPVDQFLTDKIDLGGITYQATFVIRFGGR